MKTISLEAQCPHGSLDGERVFFSAGSAGAFASGSLYSELEEFPGGRDGCSSGEFSSLSYSLAGKGVSHVAAWYDDAMGELQRCRIDDEEGTYAMVDQLLAAVPYGWKYDIENGYDKEYPGEIFAASLILDTKENYGITETVIAEFSDGRPGAAGDCMIQDFQVFLNIVGQGLPWFAVWNFLTGGILWFRMERITSGWPGS